jgi:hypothetical protein
LSASAPPSTTGKNPIEATREVAAHTARLVQLELELRVLELRRKAAEVGIGAALGLIAVLLAPLIVVFLLAAAAAALATVMQVWLAILIISGVLLLIVAGLVGGAVLLTKGAMRKGATGDDD